ncbi:MAG TPA: FHA domain-containing protein [Gemmataceae bacterium]|jgi:pSer/pThr/pTyr-binding forkhead associated (FHA) protein|nr:FHA domain-containing protein [Gemmataceae bacterium]
MRAQLIPLEGGEPIEIVKDMTLVGRKEDCDLNLDHKSVSKLHCIIVKTDGLLLVRDLGSTNGTRVNGQRIRRAALLPNDQLHVASVKFRVHLGPGEPPVSPSEQTQRIDADELAKFLNKKKEDADSDEEVPAQAVLQNPLPDVYPEDAGQK